MSPLQSQVDGLVTHFVDEAANPRTLAAIMAGGMAYRFGRIGVMAAGSGRVAVVPLRVLSVGIGLGTEVTAFEFTNRALQAFGATGQSPLQGYNPNLWSWSGQGGWAQGLLSSTITFGMLKGAGFLAREQNLILQHSFQSTAMVLGHNTAGVFGIIHRPEGSLAEQLLHAEVTNLQLGAGMGLTHMMVPGLSSFERGLDLSLHSASHGGRFPMGSRGLALALATAGGEREASRDSPDPLKLPVFAMSGSEPPQGGKTPGRPADRSVERDSFPPDDSDRDVTRPDLEAPTGVRRYRPRYPARQDAEGFEPRIEAPELLRRLPDEVRDELLEILGFHPTEVDRVSEEDIGRGVGEILEHNLAHTVLKMDDPDLIDIPFRELPQETQRSLRLVDETIGVYEYARRSDQRGIYETAEQTMGDVNRQIYEDAKEILVRLLGPQFRSPLRERATGDEVIQPHEAILSIGSGDMMALLALARHRIAPGELSWRTRLLVSARSQAAATEINEVGTYRQNPNLKNIQINHDTDPRIEAVGPLGYRDLNRDLLHRTVRLQMLNVPSKKLHEVLTEDYIRHLPENAILFEVIGGLIGPENRGIFQPGPNESPTVLPYQLIYQALERFGRRDVTVVSGGGFIPGKDLWAGRPVKMVFASRERGRGGQAPEAELLARFFAGLGLDNGFIRASFTHHQHSTELGKALKNVTTLMAGLDGGRLARRIITGVVNVHNPQGEYETTIQKPIYKLMEGFLLYNEVGIKPHRVGYTVEVENDYWRCSELNMDEVLRVMALAETVDVHNKKEMTEFLTVHVVQNPNKIASTRNPKRGLAQAIVEIWREMGSPYYAFEVMPEITEEGVDSQKPLLQLYNFRSHPYERRRVNDAFYDLYEAFHPGEVLVRPPKIGTHLLAALQQQVTGIDPAILREALEGRSETSVQGLNEEIGILQSLRAQASSAIEPDVLWQLEIVHRMKAALREGYEVLEVEHNPFSKPPYENAVLLRLNSSAGGNQKYHQVYLRVNGDQVMNRLTNLGMLLRSFEEGSQIKVVLDVEGNIDMAHQMELIATLQHILQVFAYSQREGIEVELALRSPRGTQRIGLKPERSGRIEASPLYSDILSPLVERLRASPGGERASPQLIQNEAALPSRLLDNVLKRSRVWPMLLDYVGGPINQAIRSALTRPERCAFVGVYAGGRLVEVFAVYRGLDGRPMILSHSLTSRMAKAKPGEYQDLTSVDFFDGKPLETFLVEYENFASNQNLGPLQYRLLPLRSLPLEEALVGRIDGVNPAVLWRFLRDPSPAREEMLEKITPLYEKSLTQNRAIIQAILRSYLDPFLTAHQSEIEADPVYQLLEKYRAEFIKDADASGSVP